MSVRKRKWTTRNGEHKAAWVADIVDTDGNRHLQTFENKRDAIVYHADMKPRRGHISIKTKLAAALLLIIDYHEAIRVLVKSDQCPCCCYGGYWGSPDGDEKSARRVMDVLSHARAVPYEHSKLMTADQIISLFQFDHYPIRHADGGPDEPWNISPTLIKAHRKKTAERDQPGLAKERRIDRKWDAFNRAVAKGRKPPRRKSKWPKRKFERRRS
jgi:hypothetical protein